MPGAEFFPPVSYSPVWVILGFGMLLLIAAWLVTVLVLTRRPAPVPQFVDSLPELTVTVRERYLDRIDRVERRYADGELAFSEAHHELSALVRSFAAEARGIRAPFMTLEDLRNTPHRELATTIEGLYPGAFSGSATGSIGDATQRASELVRTWN